MKSISETQTIHQQNGSLRQQLIEVNRQMENLRERLVISDLYSDEYRSDITLTTRSIIDESHVSK
jgi:hypothetical protein